MATSDQVKVVPLTCHGHSRPITHISFSSSTATTTTTAQDPEYYLISSCKDNNPMLRDGVTGDWIGTFIGHKGAVWQARLSSDACLAATGSADFSAKVWDTSTGECLSTLQHNHIVRAVAFQPCARGMRGLLATGGMEKKLRIWDLTQLDAVKNDPEVPVAEIDLKSEEIGAGVHGGTIRSIVWTTDPNILVTACDDKKIRWWDLRSRSIVAEVSVDGQIGSCEFNESDSWDKDSANDAIVTSAAPVLSVAAGKSAYFFDGTTPGQLLKKVELSYDVASVALHLGRRRFVTGSGNDTWVRLYDYDTLAELETGKGHHGPIWTVCFAPDGKLYATGSEDGTIKLWKFTKGAYGLWR